MMVIDQSDPNAFYTSQISSTARLLHPLKKPLKGFHEHRPSDILARLFQVSDFFTSPLHFYPRSRGMCWGYSLLRYATTAGPCNLFIEVRNWHRRGKVKNQSARHRKTTGSPSAFCGGVLLLQWPIVKFRRSTWYRSCGIHGAIFSSPLRL
jgi:hypothetical protein